MAFLHNFTCSCGWHSPKSMPAGPDGLMMGRLDPFWCRSCKRVWTRFTAYDKPPIPQVCRECGQQAKPWPCKCPECGKKLQAGQPTIIAD